MEYLNFTVVVFHMEIVYVINYAFINRRITRVSELRVYNWMNLIVIRIVSEYETIFKK